MIDDLKKTISSTLYERVTSPLIGSFAVSWSVWNYKFFLIVLSSESYLEKQANLHALFPWFETWQSFCYSLFNSLIMPMLGVGFYLFVYPHIAKFVYKIWQNYIADKEKIRQDVKKEIPITEEQANKLRQTLASKTIEFENLLSDKSERIKDLEARDDKNMTRIDEKEKKISELSELTKKQQTDLNVFSNREKIITEMKLTPAENGVLEGSNTRKYCSKCFYSDPVKLIKVPNDGEPGEYALCPVCSAKYIHNNYFTKSHSRTINCLIDNDFLCWKSPDGKIKICPLCAETGKERNAALAKLSDDKYVCVLCQKEYERVTPSEEQGKG